MGDLDGAAAGTDVAVPWGKRLFGAMACFAGLHHWSDWQVPDPERPGEQVKICTRCKLRKTNAAPAPIEYWKMPFK